MKKQESNKLEPDVFGEAISAYFHKKDETDIIVHSPDFDDDVIPVPFLFRSYKEMPVLEKEALKNCKGKVLDVGCGAGSHAMYLQQVKNLEVTAIDTSPGAIEICKARGIKDARILNFFLLKEEKFDTLLFLMNGSGIIGKLSRLDDFFQHSRDLLNPEGKILLDSSDLSYLFDEDEDGGIWIDAGAPYYGEMEFSLSYKGKRSKPFPWLYLDYNTLELAANMNNFECKLRKKGPHYDYLAELSVRNREIG